MDLNPDGSPRQAPLAAQLFALENLAQPPEMGSKSPKRNFARAIKKTLACLRRMEPLPEAVRPIADLLLEFSYGSERTFAYVKQQKVFGLILRKHKSEINRSLKWMVRERIIIAAGPYYAFHSGLYLRLNQRQNPDEAEIELSLERPDWQAFFPRDVNLNDQQTEMILCAVESGSTPVESGSTPVESGSTPVESGSTPVESGSTPVDSGSTWANEAAPAQGPLALTIKRLTQQNGIRVEPDSTASQLAIASIDSTGSKKLAGGDETFKEQLRLQWRATHEGALGFLEMLNTWQGDNALRQPEWAHRWNKKAASDPAYIVNHLRRKLLEEIDKRAGVAKPLGFIARIAKDERQY